MNPLDLRSGLLLQLNQAKGVRLKILEPNQCENSNDFSKWHFFQIFEALFILGIGLYTFLLYVFFFIKRCLLSKKKIITC